MKQINSKYNGGSCSSVYLLPVGDIHLGNKYYQEKYLEDALRFADKHRNRTRILLMGDLFETATKTSVGRGVYDEAYPTQKQYEKGVEIFKPYADIIDLVIIGNHEDRVIKDTSFEIVEEFSHRLGCLDVYAKFDAIVNYSLGIQYYSAYCWHGSSGGITEAAITNAMLKMRDQTICHLYCMAHTHKLFSFKRKLYIPNPEENEPKILEQMFVNTGTALGEGGYGVQRGFPLPVCGYGVVELFKNERKMVFHRLEDII
jgi:hypothetical protein